MRVRKLLAAGSVLVVSATLQCLTTGSAFAADPAEVQAETTQATVDAAQHAADVACAASAASAKVRDAASGDASVAVTAKAAEDAAACQSAQDDLAKEKASLAGASGGPTSDADEPSVPDTHHPATGAITSDNLKWVSNSAGVGSNFAGANFIHYENLGYDFMIADGTGGLSVWSLKDPAHPLLVSSVPAAMLERGEDAHGPADTQARFYEGENPTVDVKRKLVFMARDPRSFGNRSHPNGRTGVYIIDLKDPWHPVLDTYQWVPAGHTETCINDCRYLWTVGPANNGSHVNGQPQDIAGTPQADWSGVPVYVTDVRDPMHPYTYATPVDMNRNNGHTDYTHSVDVDQDGVAWTSGFGGVRGFYTNGLHHDPTTNADRYASATDPVPYAGGSVPNNDPTYGTNSIDHNAYHVTQAASDHSSPTVKTADGTTYDKSDLLYVTQENVVSCTSTSGGGAGHFVVADLAGSYGGEDWSPTLGPNNRFFLKKIGDYTPIGDPASNPGASCSAHWFSVLGDMVAIAFYGQGVRILDMSDPTHPTATGYIRIPADTPNGQPANNASAAYWHNQYVYVADYSRGVDVLKYTGPVKGTLQPSVCWNACTSSQTAFVGSNADGGVGGTVGSTLSLTLGQTAPTFGTFTPGAAKDYTSSVAANVVSSAGDATLSVADPDANATGHLVNGTFSLPSPLQAKASSPAAGAGGAFAAVGGSAAPTTLLSYSGPAANDAVTIGFQQHIGATDALRTGAYSKSLTFTLSTTTP